MINIETADREELEKMKVWFFKENVRIQQERQLLKEEREAFEKEKKETLSELKQKEMKEKLEQQRLSYEQKLFDKKFELLQNELRKLAYEKQQLEREKALLREMKEKQRVHNASSVTPKLFFKGVNSETALKKRYRDLIKIFHPDNLNGDTDTIQHINKEYDNLKKVYCM